MFNDIFEITPEKADELAPAGAGYVLSIEEAVNHASARGNPTLRVRFRVVEGGAAAIGTIVTGFFPLTAPGVRYTVPLLTACDVMLSGGKGEFEADQLLGRRILADVIHEPYNGELWARVRNIRAVST
jgi:hypothetical protein